MKAFFHRWWHAKECHWAWNVLCIVIGVDMAVSRWDTGGFYLFFSGPLILFNIELLLKKLCAEPVKRQV